MRQAFRVLGYAFWSLLSLDILLSMVDWAGRWDWFKGFIAAHPHVAAFVHTPFVYLSLLILGFVLLRAERKLKLPKLAARYTNSRIIPNLHTATMGDLFATEEKAPGWDERKLDWWWFSEIQLANDSDSPTTIDSIEVRVRTGRRNEHVIHFIDLGQFEIDMSFDANTESHSYSEPRYREIPSLMQIVHNVPLNRGIGYRGWLRFAIKQVNQRDVNGGKIKMDVWLVDALQGKHKVQFKKGSDQKWDTSFLIVEKV